MAIERAVVSRAKYFCDPDEYLVWVLSSSISIFNQVFLDPLKLTLQILSEEIIRAAAPHLGATALQLLNHTVSGSERPP